MTTKNNLSRRKFLEILGTTTVGAIAANISIPSSIGAAASNDRSDFAKALAIVVESPLYRQAIDELESKNFKFDLKQSSFQRAPNDAALIGIVLAHTISPSRKMGADIALTVNLREDNLVAANYVIGRSLANKLQVSRVNFTSGKPRNELNESFERKQFAIERGPAVMPIGQVLNTNTDNRTTLDCATLFL